MTIIFIFFALAVCANEPELIEGLIPRDIHNIPKGFPRFSVPGYESQLNTVRQMFYHHYLFFPGATYNDVYVPMSIVWPDTGSDPRYREFREGLRKMLLNRVMSAEGYVSCMQHIGLAHPRGWPFPLWVQSEGVGFHFSNDDVWIWEACGTEQLKNTDGWEFEGVDIEQLEPEKGLHFEVTADRAALTTPEFEAKGIISPFMVLHWWMQEVPNDAEFYLEWKTAKHPEYCEKHRSYFSVERHGEELIQTAVSLHPILPSDDTLTQVRLHVANAKGMRVKLERWFTAVDTRHHINSFVWIQGCDDYLKWTGDLSFLRDQINRWRETLRFSIREFQVERDRCVNVPWLGHDGREGMYYDENGERVPHYGHGLGGTYFDIIPCGGKDAASTLLLHDSLVRMAELEEQVGSHPQWNIPGGPMQLDPKDLRKLAAEVNRTYKRIFWNAQTKRFVPGIDRDGKMHDYGFLYHNLETMYYGLAGTAQSHDVYAWIDGDRIVEGDTSQGSDIYRWRFAPRTTTKRNLTYYGYSWVPKVFEWGDQVQDGGAVLAWSYYDLMNRIRLFGADNAWQRLQEIIVWFDEVQSQGGYRKYYEKPGRGRLQGGNVAGGLGLDCEFLENVMVPQVMIYGFMGLQPKLDCIEIDPKLPSDWPALTITSIRWHKKLLDVTVTNEQILVKVREGDKDGLKIKADKKYNVVIE